MQDLGAIEFTAAPCSRCRSPIAIGARFCEACGLNLFVTVATFSHDLARERIRAANAAAGKIETARNYIVFVASLQTAYALLVALVVAAGAAHFLYAVLELCISLSLFLCWSWSRTNPFAGTLTAFIMFVTWAFSTMAAFPGLIIGTVSIAVLIAFFLMRGVQASLADRMADSGGIEQSFLPPAIAAASPLASATGSGSVRRRSCVACSVALRDGARFCGACGAAADRMAEIHRRLNPPTEPQGWRQVQRVLWFYLALLAAILPLYWLRNDLIAIGEMAVSGIMALIIVRFARHDWTAISAALVPSGHALFWTVFGLVLWVPLLVFGHLYSALLGVLGVHVVNVDEPFAKDGFPAWVSIFFICIMPAVWEEIAFRGIILGALMKVVRQGEALFLMACMFAILHRNTLAFPYLALLGFLAGYLRVHSKSLLPGMVMHAVNNLCALYL